MYDSLYNMCVNDERSLGCIHPRWKVRDVFYRVQYHYTVN